MGLGDLFGGGGKAPAAKPTKDPALIEAEEKAKIRAENLEGIRAQESKRAKLRSTLQDDQGGEIKRKKLFGE